MIQNRLTNFFILILKKYLLTLNDALVQKHKTILHISSNLNYCVSGCVINSLVFVTHANIKI